MFQISFPIHLVPPPLLFHCTSAATPINSSMARTEGRRMVGLDTVAVVAAAALEQKEEEGEKVEVAGHHSPSRTQAQQHR